MVTVSQLPLVFTLLLTTLFSVTGQAGFLILGTVPVKSRAYQDMSNPTRVLVLDENNQSYWFSQAGLQQGVRYRSVDPECFSQTNELENLIFAAPYLVGLEHICQLDEASQKIVLISKQPALTNAFSMIFVRRDEQKDYYLLNGSSAEGGGYLKLRTLNRATGEVTTQDLMTDVPGYSAGMWFDGRDAFVTTWEGENQIYLVNLPDWGQPQNLNPATLLFGDMSSRGGKPFAGLSLQMFGNQDQFLFFNSGYESYVIDRNSDTQTTVVIPSECTVVGPWSKSWLLLCSGTELRAESF